MQKATNKARGIIFRVLPMTVLLGVVVYGGTVLATPGSGVSGTLPVQGTLQPIDVKMKSGDWEVEIKTEGLSDLAFTENRLTPGGHFGWHSHPGPSLVIVKSGTLSFYRGDDPTCTRQLQPAGTAFVDPGGVVHIGRNEGNVDLVILTTRLVPSGAAPHRIDDPNPGNCTSKGF